MKESITVTKINEVFLYIESDNGVAAELEDNFKFLVPGYKFMSKYRSGVWDGYIKIFSQYKRLFPIGIYDQLKEFCNIRDYELRVGNSPHGSPDDTEHVDPKELHEYITSLNLHTRNEPIKIRSYQLEAIYKALKYQRRTILSPTGSGKSSIIYCISRYLAEQGKRILIVCPTTQLVEQMFGDFGDYSSEIDWSNETNCHKIYSGYEKQTNKPIVISTWQSLMRLPDTWFKPFDCVIIDEVHGAKSTQLQKILENCSNAKHRYGLTGSLDNSATHQTMIRGMIGPIITVAKTSELIEQGYLSEIKIKTIILDYPDEVKKAMKKIDYQSEIQYLVSHEKRNRFITNLAASLSGNTLILYALVEKHGKVLYEMIQRKCDGRQVFFIHGEVDVEDRAIVGKVMKEHGNAIAVASVGTFSVGINIPEIDNVIFASPTKSVIRVLQSIGRGLRKSKDKEHFKLFDIGDKLSNSKTKPNHTYQHLIHRLEIYTKEDFDYTITTIPMGNNDA